MTLQTVSCVVPAYNAERFLSEAVQSALEQTHPVLEVIVVDDGSTDGTAETARRIDSRVRLVQTEHRGYLAARDEGLAVARGQYIAFLDADDIWVREKTERQVHVLSANPRIDLAVGHYLNFWDPEIADEESKYRGHPASQPLSGYVVPTLMAPRKAFDRFGTFSSGESDTAWFARAVSAGATLETLPDVLLRRRLHRGNHSRLNPTSIDGLFDLISTRHRRPG